MSYIGNVPTTAAFLTDTFSGNGSTTAFTMSVAPATTSSVLVSITGVLQSPDTYSVSGTTLTFSAAPPSGTNNISARYLGIPASGVTTTAYRTVTNFTATAGQTSFSVPSYTVGYIDVYRNGVRLVSTDYTATTGTTVVLNNACTVGDAVVTESFLVSSVLNAIPATAGSISSTYLASSLTLTTPTLTSPIITGSTPQVTTYTSGSGTYTVPTNARYLQIKMVGGGGGGGGVTGNNGSVGGNTTFGTATAGGGSAGVYAGAGGQGGTTTNSYSGVALSGGDGGTSTQAALFAGTGTNMAAGGGGGNSAFGGGGSGAYPSTAAFAGKTNTGGGGGGGAYYSSGSVVASASGGGAGGYVEAYITSPASTYSYSVGAGGAAGAAGTGGSAGGAGGSGIIYITAFF